MQQRKASLPIRINLGGSQMSDRATQCDFSAHEVDLDQSLAVFTGLRAKVVEIAWETEALDASSAETAIRQCSRLIGFVHGEGDRCEREAAFEGKTAQLRPGCKNIGGLLIIADAHFAE